MDYSFFALMFLIASALAPRDARELTLQNLRHPEQSIVWTRQADGAYAMRLNERDVGTFRRDEANVVHTTGARDPDRFEIAALVDPSALRPDASELALRGAFRGTTLRIERRNGDVNIVDPEGHLLGASLRLLVSR